MHILFVDESGTPPKSDVDHTRYFVVGGIAIPEASWSRIRDGLMGLKIRRKLRGELKWRYFSPNNDDDRNPMRSLDQETRDSIRTEIYQLICQEKAVRTIASICSVKAAYAMQSVSNQTDVYHLTYKTITERFQYYLQDLKKVSGRDEFGIIVCDQRSGNDDKRLRDHHHKLLYSGANFVSSYKNLVESLFLQQSNHSVGIQLADLVAGAVWRKFERGDDRWFELLKPSLRRDPNGNIDGWGIVKCPKKGWE